MYHTAYVSVQEYSNVEEQQIFCTSRTVLPTCAKNACGQVQTTNCSNTHTLARRSSINLAQQRALWLHASTHIHTDTHTCIIALFAQSKNKTKHKRMTNNNNNMRKNQLTSIVVVAVVVAAAGHANRSACARALLALAKSSTFSFHFLCLPFVLANKKVKRCSC